MNEQLRIFPEAEVRSFCLCSEGQHPRFEDCPMCHGDGHMMGGEEYRACPSCKIRYNRSAETR